MDATLKQLLKHNADLERKLRKANKRVKRLRAALSACHTLTPLGGTYTYKVTQVSPFTGLSASPGVACVDDENAEAEALRDEG